MCQLCLCVARRGRCNEGPFAAVALWAESSHSPPGSAFLVLGFALCIDILPMPTEN
jgi:hypothetical protein